VKDPDGVPVFESQWHGATKIYDLNA